MSGKIALSAGILRWWIAPLAYLLSMVVLIGASLIGLEPELGQGAIFTGYVLLASLIAWAFARRNAGSELGLIGQWDARRVVGVAFAVAALILLISEGAALINQDIADSTKTVLSSIGFGTETRSDIIIIVTICCLAPLGEEALYRGLIFRPVFNGLHSVAGPTAAAWSAAAIAAVVFALSHGGDGQEASVIAVLFLSGLIYGLCYAVTGSLWTPILAHSVNNAVAMGLVILPSGETGWTSKALLCASPLITAALFWLWARKCPR